MSVEFSDLENLVADLAAAGIRAGIEVHDALDASAQRIEDTARAFAPRRGVPHYASTINHDVTVESRAIAAEIGPDRSVNGQAKLANIFEYGTSELPPRAHLGPALDLETPAFVEAVKEIGGDIL